MSGSAALLLIRPRGVGAMVAWLQVGASGVTALLSFAVAMLSIVFWTVPSEEVGYQVLGFGLIGTLLVPLVTLGTASARLAARSRDERLATLRLLGATSSRVRLLAVAEVTAISAAGVAGGTLLSAGLPFVFSLLTVYGMPLSVGQLWPPWWLAVAVPPTLVLVAAVSALLGLRRVVLTPLGVRTRAEAPRMSWLRLVLAVAVVGAAVAVMQSISPSWGVVLMLAVMAAVVLAVMAVLGVVGPFAVSVIARRTAARTADPARLIAARGIHDDPRAALRGVSALALASFILIPAGSLLGYLDTISRSQSREIMTPDQLLLFADARTMLLALTAIAFLVVACQVAITQTAAIIENRDLYVALDRLGMPLADTHRARRVRVTGPANVAVIGAAIAAVALGFFIVMIALFVAPLFVMAIVVVLVLGLLLVRAGVAVTGPMLRRVLAAPVRGE